MTFIKLTKYWTTGPRAQKDVYRHQLVLAYMGTARENLSPGHTTKYSKICVKQPLKNGQNLNDKW